MEHNGEVVGSCGRRHAVPDGQPASNGYREMKSERTRIERGGHAEFTTVK
jgi:hypothetical protein